MWAAPSNGGEGAHGSIESNNGWLKVALLFYLKENEKKKSTICSM